MINSGLVGLQLNNSGQPAIHLVPMVATTGGALVPVRLPPVVAIPPPPQPLLPPPLPPPPPPPPVARLKPIPLTNDPTTPAAMSRYVKTDCSTNEADVNFDIEEMFTSDLTTVERYLFISYFKHLILS